MLWHKRSVRATCLLINILANILFLFSSLRNSKNWFLYFRISEYYAFRETKGFVVFSTWSMFYMTWSDVFSDLANTCHFPQPGPSSSFIFILTLDRPLPPHHQPHATFVFSSAAAELWRCDVLEIKGTKKASMYTDHFWRSGKAKAVSPLLPPQPSPLPPPIWLVSIATAGG